MIYVELQRKLKNDHTIYGNITVYDEEIPILILQTIENRKRAITAGCYTLRNTHSNKFRTNLWLIENIPNRTGIRIHPANDGRTELEGCIAPYMIRNNNKGLYSREALSYLNKVLEKNKIYKIIIKDEESNRKNFRKSISEVFGNLTKCIREDASS